MFGRCFQALHGSSRLSPLSTPTRLFSASMAAQLKQALLVIDMQNEFVLPEGALPVKGAPACIPHVQDAIKAAREHAIPVIWVIREHHASGCDIEGVREHLFKDGGKGTLVPGTWGVELVAGLEPRPEEVVLVKKRWSAFFATPLDLILRRLGVGRVVVSGVQTPNCIRATAYDAVSLDYPQVTVLSDATASATDAVQEANLFDMRNAGVDTPTVAEWQRQQQQ